MPHDPESLMTTNFPVVYLEGRSERELLALKWLHAYPIGGFGVREDGVVVDWKGDSYGSLIRYAQRYGWRG